MKGIDVKKKLQSDRFTIKEIADIMGETPQNVQALLKVEDIKTGVLERIAKAIGKDILYFYEVEIKSGSNLDEMQLAIDITKNRKNVYFLYQRIVDIDNILEKFNGEKQSGYASDVSHLYKLVFDNYKPSSDRRLDEDGDEIKFVFVDGWSLQERYEYNNKLKEACETLSTAFFDRFHNLFKKLKEEKH